MRSPSKVVEGARVTKTKFLVAQQIMRVLAAFAVCVTFGTSELSANIVDVGHIVRSTGNQIDTSTIIVMRESDGQRWISNPERARRRFSPASSSKIPHTLIALESGLATPATVFIWDGVYRSSRKWNTDQTLASAFKHSAVWVYQEIARTAGQDTMSEGLARFEYGNENIGTASQLTTYWLDDTLKISAVEQVAFLSNLSRRLLPLTRETYTTAFDIMESDRGTKWIMRSKTGWRYSETSMDVGWHVGWLECSDETYVFALNMDMPDTRYLSSRTRITYSVLKEIKAFDCQD